MAEKKSVLITGCSSGIGRCIALGLHQRGYRVFATVRNADDVAALTELGMESLVLDLDSSSSIHEAVDEVAKRCDGQLYALVNNGAYGQPGAVEDLSRKVLRRQFETNLFGTHELTNAVLPLMRRYNEGRIIQMSSILGFMCLAYRGAYQATKYALEALSDTLRLELRGTNIRVCLIEPGPITSRFREHAYTAFKANIDQEHSPHREVYRFVEQRLASEDDDTLFTLPPEAVLKRVIRALEARRPRVRYSVTVPTYVYAGLRRLLPDRAFDWLLAKTGDMEHR